MQPCFRGIALAWCAVQVALTRIDAVRIMISRTSCCAWAVLFLTYMHFKDDTDDREPQHLAEGECVVCAGLARRAGRH